MSEFENHIETKVGSEKGFGIVFAILFLLIGLYPVVAGEGMRFWALIAAIVFLGLACFAPKILSVPNKLWFMLGTLLGSIVSPIIMALIYIITVIPTSLIVRLMRKDLLQQKIDKNAKSYWIERDHTDGSMKDQF